MDKKLQLNGYEVKSSVSLTFSSDQLDLIFNNEEFSDVTLISEDNQVYYARWALLQLRWMWLGGLKNVKKAKYVKEDDSKQVHIAISGKMLYTILKWAYYEKVDFTRWSSDDLCVFIEKCQEFKLRDLEVRAKKQVKKMTSEGTVQPCDVGRVYKYAVEEGDKTLVEQMVSIAIDRVEHVVNTEEFSRFPPELIAKMAHGLTEDKYSLFLKSIPKWSRERSSKELDVVMRSINWSIVPIELVSALASHYAWDSKEVKAQLENLEISQKTINECALEKDVFHETKVSEDDPRINWAYTLSILLLIMLIINLCLSYYVLTLPAQLSKPVDEVFESTGSVIFELKKGVKGQKASWNCKPGHVTRVEIYSDRSWHGVDVGNDYTARRARLMSGIVLYATEDALINSINLTLV